MVRIPEPWWCVYCLPDADQIEAEINLETGVIHTQAADLPRQALGTLHGLPACGHCGTIKPGSVAETLAEMGHGDGTLTVETHDEHDNGGTEQC